MAAQTTRAFGERRALGPLNIQNNRPEARPTKPLNQQQSTHYTNYLAGQENQFSYHENKASLVNKTSNAASSCHGLGSKNNVSFQIYDEGIYSQEMSTKPCDDERLLSDNIEAVKKELNSFLIDTIEKNSSELSERESNKENRSTLSYVEDSFMAVDSKENSVAGDSVLDQSEISYVQHCGQFDRFADYADDILPYMLMKERKYMPDPFYMNSQPNINSKMRSILVDWLVDVADEYKIRDETLFLAISYIDRFVYSLRLIVFLPNLLILKLDFYQRSPLAGKSFSFWELRLCLLPPSTRRFIHLKSANLYISPTIRSTSFRFYKWRSLF